MNKLIARMITDSGEKFSFVPRFLLWVYRLLGGSDVNQPSVVSGVELNDGLEFTDIIGSISIYWRRWSVDKPGHWYLTCTSRTTVYEQILRIIDEFLSGATTEYSSRWTCLADSMCVPMNGSQHAEASFDGLNFLDGILTIRGDGENLRWKAAVNYMKTVFNQGLFNEIAPGVISIDLNSVKFEQPVP